MALKSQYILPFSYVVSYCKYAINCYNFTKEQESIDCGFNFSENELIQTSYAKTLKR